MHDFKKLDIWLRQMHCMVNKTPHGTLKIVDKKQSIDFFDYHLVV